MSNYTNLRNGIISVIKTNGNNEITGQLLQNELLAMITTLGYGYQFMGIATPTTTPGTPDAKVFYIAYTPGTYTNFGGISVTGLCVLKYATSWTKEDIPVSGGGGGTEFVVEPTDLTLESGTPNKLKFADRPYNSINPDGLGYKILRKDQTFAQQVTDTNTIYEVRYDFNLGGASFTLPTGSVFYFNGGSVYGGTLSGELNATNPIDVKNLGLVYGVPSASSTNTNRLKILSGVTNKVDLELSGDLYLGNDTGKIVWKHLSINGNDHTINLDSFVGFEISGDIELKYCKIIGSNPVAEFIEVQNIGTYHPDYVFEGNSISGDIRVITAINLYSNDGSVYVNEVNIINNRFENIHFSIWGNVIFNFADSNFINLFVVGNIVHNFYAQFIGCGVSSNEIDSAIFSFSQKIGRSFYVKDNKVWNDLNFKPWTLYDSTAYFVFILAEVGYCSYTGNEIRNLIDKKRDGSDTGSVYDSYLSVDVLDNNNNTIEDCWKYEDGFHLMRSKGGHNGIRRYCDNIYIGKDMTADPDFPDNVVAFITTDTYIDELYIKGCSINVQNWAGRSVHTFAVKELEFSKNNVVIQSITGSYSDYCICNCGSACRKVNIENNNIELVTPPTTNYYFGVFSPSGANALVECYVQIKNNILHNCLPIGGDTVLNAGTSVVEISGNIMKIDDHAYSIIDSGALGGNGVEIVKDAYHFAKIYTGRVASYSFMKHKDVVYNIDQVNGTGTIIFRGSYVTTPSSGNEPEIYAYLLKLDFLDTGRTFTLAFNTTKKLVDGTYKNVALVCAYDGTVSEVTSPVDVALFNFSGVCTNSVPTKAVRRLLLSLTSTRIEISFRPFAGDRIRVNYERITISDFKKMQYYLQSGTNAQRPALLPTDAVGFAYYDQTLNKPIFAKAIDASTGAVTWADASGTTV